MVIVSGEDRCDLMRVSLGHGSAYTRPARPEQGRENEKYPDPTRSAAAFSNENGHRLRPVPFNWNPLENRTDQISATEVTIRETSP